MTSWKPTREQDLVVAEIEIAAPPERVFQALTNATQLFTWWGKEPSVILSRFDMEVRKGGKYFYACKPAPGASHGDVGEQLKKNQAQEFRCHGAAARELVVNVEIFSATAVRAALPHPGEAFHGIYPNKIRSIATSRI